MCHACVRYENKIYVIGGCSEKKQVIGRRRALQEIPEVYDDMWELDTATWKWNKLEARLHNKTCFHAAVVTKGGYVHVFGGVVDGAFTKRCSVMQRLWLRVPSLEYLTMQWCYPFIRNCFTGFTGIYAVDSGDIDTEHFRTATETRRKHRRYF
uniref:Uncharacterized protein n=1 Tax=Parascaris univalens TaxID=6257 RepID=A0A914ZNZ8_PARUN